MIITTISSKYQIVIPKKIRTAVNLAPGQILTISTTANGEINLKPAPQNIDQIIGIAKDVFQKPGGSKKYLAKERQSWKD